MIDYQALITQCDLDIRAGRLREVERRISSITTTQVPRKWRLPLAKTCRRSGATSLGLRLLARVVHGQQKILSVAATPGEIAEYAALLIRHGAHVEALRLLTKVDSITIPEADLYRAFAHFRCREFTQSVPCLANFLSRCESLPNQLLGRVNLAYALVSCDRISEAQLIIPEAIELTRKTQNRRLEANCLALLAQVEQMNGNFDAAIEICLQALALLDRDMTTDQLFVRRCLSLSQALKAKEQAPIHEFKKLAQASSDWDMVREADFFLLMIQHEEHLFNYLIFGTPFPEFRQKILRTLGRTPQEDYFLHGSPNGSALDLETGTMNGKSILDPGRSLHRILTALSKDFYRPLTIGGVFSELFPGEDFDIDSSPDRVHQLLSRARKTLAKQDWSAHIVENDGFYALDINAPFAVRVRLHRETSDVNSEHLKAILQLENARSSFTAREAQKKLGLSKAAVHSLLQWAVDSGKLHKSGKTNRTIQYRAVG